MGTGRAFLYSFSRGVASAFAMLTGSGSRRMFSRMVSNTTLWISRSLRSDRQKWSCAAASNRCKAQPESGLFRNGEG